MLKKCAILGLAVLLVGGAALTWLFNETRSEQQPPAGEEVKYSLRPEDYISKYGRWNSLSPEQQNQLVLELDKERKTKTREELAKEQQARLRLDLDKLAAGEMNPGEIADFLYGSDWEEQVELYKKRKEQREIAQTISIVCLPIGGTILAGCFLIWLFQSFARLLRKRKQAKQAPSDKPVGQPVVAELTDLSVYAPADEVENPAQKKAGRGRISMAQGTNATTEDEQAESFLPHRYRDRAGKPQESPAAQQDAGEGGVAVLVKDEQEAATEQNENEYEEETGPNQSDEPPADKPEKRRFTPRPKVAVLGRELSALRDEKDGENAPSDSSNLQEQADDLQQQLADFRRMAQSVQQATREQSEPLGSTLKDLAQQVSAIREYAASQQNRVEKLQDGYDWNIIRTFCLRVIRCIDNLENRVDSLTDNDETAAHLEEVRDELLFALESSGVEQFQLEPNSEYRGQEKLAEAVKEKEAAEDTDQAGKIAKVIRPGYRYMIDEESFKVVRTAQVKLFG